jgi:hypothetical protein
MLLVVTRELSKFDSRGNELKTQIFMEFTIAATSKTSDAAGLDMEEAVVQGKDAVLSMKLAPSSFGLIQGAVDTSAVVGNDIKSLSATLDSLLHKVKFFTKLVDGITRVSV